MGTESTPVPGPSVPPEPPAESASSGLRKACRDIRGRILGGVMLVLPILITFWLLYLLYSTLKTYAIDPLARIVLWKILRYQPDAELPYWFEHYAAPVIGILVALLLLYALGFFVQSRLRGALDAILLRLPGVSLVYNGVRQVFQTLDKPRGKKERPQRVVLVQFPHPGMKAPAFVTATCRDVATKQPLLCVYVPTTPVPTSGYFLIVPEEEVTEPDWSPDQALQTIITGGLTAPPEVAYSKNWPARESNAATRVPGETSASGQGDARVPADGARREFR